MADAAEASTIPGLTEEFFAPVLTVLRVAHTDSATTSVGADAAPTAARCGLTEGFLRAMPEFAARGLWGNLVASVYAPPEVRAEGIKDAWRACIDELEYGSVVVNGPTYVPFSFPVGVWGGFAGEDASAANPGSGVGMNLNTRLVENVQKQVITFDDVFDVPPSELPLPAPVTKALIGLLTNGAKGLLAAALP